MMGTEKKEAKWAPSPGDWVQVLTTKASYDMAVIESWSSTCFTISYTVYDDGTAIRKKASINISDLVRLRELDRSL